MRRFVLFILFATLTFFILRTPAFSQERTAECDLCGYCKNYVPTPPQTNPPAKWEECRQCLYPTANPTPSNNDTLRIDLSSNMPPTPWPGRMYTMIGCVNTNINDFTQEGAAANIVNFLLNRLIFPMSGGIALSFLIYGAFLILTSQSEPDKLNHGQRVVMGAIIGIIFVLLTVFIVNFVAGILKIPGISTP